MKAIKMLMMAALTIFSVAVYAQDTTSSKSNMQMEQMKYSCPMHPEVASNKKGKCSKCGMALTKTNKNKMAMQEMKMYSCPMHPEVTSDKPGQCSRCGMDLKEMPAVAYSCPMKCEGDKTYDKSGKCPTCGMALTKTEKNKMAMQDMKMYSCPMHQDVTSNKPGQCSKCGMDLKEMLAVAYSCPMKCEGDKTYNKPGSCPKCGMDLKKKTDKKEDHSGHNH